MWREMGGRFKKEGAYVYPWLILVDVRQKTKKFCKAIIIQLKNKYIKKNKIPRVLLKLHLIAKVDSCSPSFP